MLMTPANFLPFLTFLLPFVAGPVAADTYNMVKEYAGQTFFDDWQFYDHCEYLNMLLYNGCLPIALT